MAVVMLSSLSYVLVAIVCVALALARLAARGRPSPNEAPGPFKWPLFGNLHLLRGFAVPYQAFNHLRKTYGDVYSLQMGSVPAVVVHGFDNIRQVLVHKAHHFDSRPNFDRYHQLFHGNKENSLAFCDWSDLQKKRRDMLKTHTFPKVYTQSYKHLDRLICDEFTHLINDIRNATPTDLTVTSHKAIINTLKDGKEELPKSLRRLMENKHVETIIHFPHYFREAEAEPHATDPVPVIEIKDKLSRSIGNAFLRYFCSADLGRSDPDLARFVRDFDEIFYEVNQGYAFDFLPFLGIFHARQIRRAQRNSESIRRFVMEKLNVAKRMEAMEESTVENDYLDALIKTVKFPSEDDVAMSLETALFSLEDIIGGHSAIANFLVKLLQYLAGNAAVQAKIREEASRVGKEFITLSDRCEMPYTEAVVMETLRLLSSPIVPHVANQDTSICGYTVKKDTLIFLNNYDLNMSPELWSPYPELFDPSRFIDPVTGAKTKPSHFLPFGGGKRSCMGYKLVQLFSFVFVANIVNTFDVSHVAGEGGTRVSTGSLALPPKRPYKFEFRARVK